MLKIANHPSPLITDQQIDMSDANSNVHGTNNKNTNDAKPSRKDLARQTKPIVCYAVESLPPLKGGAALYRTLGTAVANNQATLIQRLSIPPRSALAWNVPAGHLWRIICTHGPQVADMNCWSASDPNEHFYSSKTRQIHATHLSTGDRLWSNMPYLRPLATITCDTIDYGFDEDGAGVHDVIGSRCDPYTHYLMTGTDYNYCCHSNLTRAALSYNKKNRDNDDTTDNTSSIELKECHIHDVLNVFMCTGFTRDTHQYFTKPSPVDVGDYIEFVAETDLVVSASTCPQGDVSLACGGGGEPIVYPLGVEIYKLEEGLLEGSGWSPSDVNGYSGNHGL
jgi:uncharacterized protein YcgI (DUF1989 family)